jgi:hypothetical protein
LSVIPEQDEEDPESTLDAVEVPLADENAEGTSQSVFAVESIAHAVELSEAGCKESVDFECNPEPLQTTTVVIPGLVEFYIIAKEILSVEMSPTPKQDKKKTRKHLTAVMTCMAEALIAQHAINLEELDSIAAEFAEKSWFHRRGRTRNTPKEARRIVQIYSDLIDATLAQIRGPPPSLVHRVVSSVKKVFSRRNV